MNLDWKEIDYAAYCKLRGMDASSWMVEENKGVKGYHLNILDLNFTISNYDRDYGEDGFILRIFGEGDGCSQKCAYKSDNKILNAVKDMILSNIIHYGSGGEDCETAEKAKQYAEEKLSLILEIAQGKHQGDLEAVLEVVGRG